MNRPSGQEPNGPRDEEEDMCEGAGALGIGDGRCPSYADDVTISFFSTTAMWLQKEIQLAAKPRGFHLITAELLRELRGCAITASA